MSYRSPGVYNKEIDASLYVKGASTSVAGMVGVTVKGPVGVPTLVTSWPQFVEVFGAFHANGWLPHAAKAFFDEGGAVLYVTRTVHYTDVTDAATATSDTATITAMQSGGAVLALTINALSPGIWANGYTIDIADVTADDFSLVVRDDDGNQLERFAGLTVADATAADFVENAINGNSLYIAVAHADGLPMAAEDLTLANGADGLANIADADFVGSAAGRTGLNSFDTIDTIKLLAVPGVTAAAVYSGLAAYAEARGTMFAVLGAANSLTPTTAIAARGAIDNGYAAFYWPWIKMADPQTGRLISAPVEGHVLGMIARSDFAAGVWGAPAGLNRGNLRTALGVAYDTTQGERDELYDKQVNVLATFSGAGTVVWGQKVMLAKPSALDRINVRRLLNTVKESVRDTARWLLFEPNDARTWASFKRFMNPYLQNIKESRGLYDFAVICDETTNTPYYIDRNQMVAKVYLKPTKTAEFIEIQYIVTGSGVDFSEI